MHRSSASLQLSDRVFVILRDLIHERTGLFYDHTKRDMLAHKLAPRVIACMFESFLDYYYFLKYDAAGQHEYNEVLNALSVQETYFWREFDAIHTLVHSLVPRWVEAHPHQPLKIWSAACATGEEPLSIVMALHEAGWFARVPIEVYGSDGSSTAIALAQRGVYRERSFRNLPADLRARYFTQTAEGWRIDPAIHGRVQWSIANLMVPAEFASLARAPFIFCRNVFLYFSADTVRATVLHFADYAPSPGYVFVGVAESLLRLSTPFQLQEVEGAFVYVKP